MTIFENIQAKTSLSFLSASDRSPRRAFCDRQITIPAWQVSTMKVKLESEVTFVTSSQAIVSFDHDSSVNRLLVREVIHF